MGLVAQMVNAMVASSSSVGGLGTIHKHSNIAADILVHSNKVIVYSSSPKQFIDCSRKPWALYGIQTELWFVCEMSSLPDILWTIVFGFVAAVIGVSLRFTSRKPKQSSSVTEMLIHSKRVMVSSSIPKQLTTCSTNPWDLYGIQTELWFVYGMSSLPDILWIVVSWSRFWT